jgi:hypothetical protein
MNHYSCPSHKCTFYFENSKKINHCSEPSSNFGILCSYMLFSLCEKMTLFRVRFVKNNFYFFIFENFSKLLWMLFVCPREYLLRWNVFKRKKNMIKFLNIRSIYLIWWFKLEILYSPPQYKGGKSTDAMCTHYTLHPYPYPYP